MSIVVKRSPNEDYFSSIASSSSGESLDEFIEHNLQAEEVQGYRIEQIRDSYSQQ